MSREPIKLIVAICSVLALAACKGDDTSVPTDNDNNEAPNNEVVNNDNNPTNAEPGGLQVLPSKNPTVKFKGGERWANQLARGLELERGELCNEFGQYDCASEVHFIALGGVEPYRLRIDEPLPSAPITAPIAVERIALSACAERADRDVDNPGEAAIFKELSDEPSNEDLDAMSNRLYQRLMSRDAEPDELAELQTYWQELSAETGVDVQREWAMYSCFALASSTEMLFY